MSASRILIDALRGVNSPFGKRPNAKVAEFLAGMLESTPKAFSVATTASDGQEMTIQLQIKDHDVVIDEFNRQHRRAGRRRAYFSYLDQLIAVHHEKIDDIPTYKIVLKLYDNHYVLHKSGKSSNDSQRKKKLPLLPVPLSKRQTFDESSAYEGPVDGEDLSSSQSIQPSTAPLNSAEAREKSSGRESQDNWYTPLQYILQYGDTEDLNPFLSLDLSPKPKHSPPLKLREGAETGDESSGREAQKPVSLSNSLSELLLSLPEPQEGGASSKTRETTGFGADSGVGTGNDVLETALNDASATELPSTCYIKPNETSFQGDNVTIICSTLQKDTRYWVKFLDGMERIEAVCEMSRAGQPCLKIKAPSNEVEQPGTFAVTIQDFKGQTVNDCPLTLTYISEETSFLDNTSSFGETNCLREDYL